MALSRELCQLNFQVLCLLSSINFVLTIEREVEMENIVYFAHRRIMSNAQACVIWIASIWIIQAMEWLRLSFEWTLKMLEF